MPAKFDIQPSPANINSWRLIITLRLTEGNLQDPASDISEKMTGSDNENIVKKWSEKSNLFYLSFYLDDFPRMLTVWSCRTDN